MPTFHPDPPRVPPHLHSEQEVLTALRSLPPEAHVFVRLQLLDPASNRDRELDFLVTHPDLGLVIIEVKGRGVEPRGDHWVRRGPEGREERLEETPGEQLAAEQYALLEFLKQSGLGFIPQVTRILALPALKLEPDQALGPDLPACRILTRDKLRQPFLALRAAVAGGAGWDAWQRNPASRNHQVRPDVLRQILGAMLPRLLPPPSLAELLRAEGRVQDYTAATLLEHLAQNFSRGRYHLEGGPGSGKSLLGRQVTRLWAAEGRRVLVVAFNRALTHATQVALDDLTGEGAPLVTTYHDLAVNLLRTAGRVPEFTGPADFFNRAVPEALAALLGDPGSRPEPQWDALVLDEAQDLEPGWVTPLLGLLRDPLRDPLLLLEDPAQSLYREARHLLGQPWRLDLSLRQHPAIRRAACLALPGCGWAPPDEGPGDGAVSVLRSRPETWKRDLAGCLEALAKDGIQPGQVLVLAPHRPATLGLKDGQRLGPWPLNAVPDWWEEERAGQVRMGTVHAFKGLEADVVVYLAPAYRHSDAQRLAYTAFSRARHRLVVLEKAIPQPPREPVAEARPAAPPPPPGPARMMDPEQRLALAGALTAAKHWKP